MTEQVAQDANATDNALDAESQASDQAMAQDARPNEFDTLPDWAKSEIETLRKRSATYRTKAKELEGASLRLKEIEDAQKTEAERLQSERDEFRAKYETLAAQLRDTQAESAFLDAAQKANAVAPKTLFRAYKSELEYDDDGSVTNLAAVIEKAQADEPTLFRASTGSADGGRKGEAPTERLTMNDALRMMRDQAPR